MQHLNLSLKNSKLEMVNLDEDETILGKFHIY